MEAEIALSAVEEEFRVQLELFEGPLDLLLFLIRKNELEITELALAQVTGQYLAYLELFKSLSISVAGDYLVHAASLIELKSGLLLPRPDEPAVEPAESPAEELLRRLREREQLKALVLSLAALQEKALRVWTRPPVDLGIPREYSIEGNALELCYALEELLRQVRRRSPVHEVTLEEFSVTDKLQHLTLAIETEGRLDLTGILAASSSRAERVAFFLAALEMTRLLGPVRLVQSTSFGRIELVWETP